MGVGVGGCRIGDAVYFRIRGGAAQNSAVKRPSFGLFTCKSRAVSPKYDDRKGFLESG